MRVSTGRLSLPYSTQSMLMVAIEFRHSGNHAVAHMTFCQPAGNTGIGLKLHVQINFKIQSFIRRSTAKMDTIKENAYCLCCLSMIWFSHKFICLSAII